MCVVSRQVEELFVQLKHDMTVVWNFTCTGVQRKGRIIATVWAQFQLMHDKDQGSYTHSKDNVVWTNNTKLQQTYLGMKAGKTGVSVVSFTATHLLRENKMLNITDTNSVSSIKFS